MYVKIPYVVIVEDIYNLSYYKGKAIIRRKRMAMPWNKALYNFLDQAAPRILLNYWPIKVVQVLKYLITKWRDKNIKNKYGSQE